MTRRATYALLILMAAGLCWAQVPPDGSNAVSVSDTAGVVKFAYGHTAVCVINDGANPAYVRLWRENETQATMTSTLAGARKINAGESYCPPVSVQNFRFLAAGHICTTGLTTTLRVWAED